MQILRIHLLKQPIFLQRGCHAILAVAVLQAVATEVMGFSGDKPVHVDVKASRARLWQSVHAAAEKTITFVDLCGHEAYLKTTIYGLTGEAVQAFNMPQGLCSFATTTGSCRSFRRCRRGGRMLGTEAPWRWGLVAQNLCAARSPLLSWRAGLFPDYALVIVGSNMGVSRMTREVRRSCGRCMSSCSCFPHVGRARSSEYNVPFRLSTSWRCSHCVIVMIAAHWYCIGSGSAPHCGGYEDRHVATGCARQDHGDRVQGAATGA